MTSLSLNATVAVPTGATLTLRGAFTVKLNGPTILWPLPIVRGSMMASGATRVVSMRKSTLPAFPWVFRDHSVVMTGLMSTFGFAEAAAKLALPAWFAVSAQVPAPTMVS